jgi:hypothetical protein
MAIKMEYPTWDEISKKVLGQVNLINPVNVYGNTAFVLDKKTNPKCVCNNPQYTQDLVGVDIPVLLSQVNKASKGIIVILGESPLRTRNDKDDKNNIVFGLPYAVHMDMNNPAQSRMYKKIFNKLLNEGYSIYLTDIIKDWWKGRKLDPMDLDVDLFKEELQILQNYYNLSPDKITIVCFGKKAEKAVNKINVGNFISLPHPSKLNWSIWKLRIFEKAVYKGNPSYAIERYPEPGSPTKENIVVNEIIAEIFEALGVSQHP